MADESRQSSKARIIRRRSDTRTVYDFESKLAILRAATMPGASVTKVSLEHGINGDLLRKWSLNTWESAAVQSTRFAG